MTDIAANETKRKLRLVPGTVIDERYEVLDFLGEGGMSVVYLARQLQFGRDVALKMLHRKYTGNEEAIERFKREAVASASLDHPNVVKVFGFGVHDNMPYMAMELLNGISLADVLKRDSRLSKEKALPIFEQILAGLSYAHEHGIVHRDLKPSNIMLVDEEKTVKIVDFGIAKVLPDSGRQVKTLTATDDVFGTVQYMSPEQCTSAKVDGRSDLYSLACLMFEVLDGKPPFVGSTAYATMAKHMGEEPMRSEHIDGTLEQAIFHALAKDPVDRFQSGAEFLSALSKGVVSSAKVGGRRKANVNVRFIATVALIVLPAAIAIGAVAFLSRPASDSRSVPTELASPLFRTPEFQRALRQRVTVSFADSAHDMIASLEQCKKLKECDAAGLMAVYALEAEAYTKLNDSSHAMDVGKNLLSMSPPNGFSPYYFDGLCNLFDHYAAHRTPPECVALAQRMHDYMASFPWRKDEQAVAELNLAKAFSLVGRQREAIQHYRNAVDFYQGRVKGDDEKVLLCSLKYSLSLALVYPPASDPEVREAKKNLDEIIGCSGKNPQCESARQRARKLLREIRKAYPSVSL